jgi:hypothetical protein
MRFRTRKAWPCPVCGREARVFDSAPDRPTRRTCSYPCNDALTVVLDERGGQDRMTEKLTDMEREAIKAARVSLYEALVKIGRAEAFNDASAEEMDSVIDAVWRGCRDSMQSLIGEDGVPF